MRDLSMPGLGDLHEAIQTVLCHGSIEPMQLIRDKLEIGDTSHPSRRLAGAAASPGFWLPDGAGRRLLGP